MPTSRSKIKRSAGEAAEAPGKDDPKATRELQHQAVSRVFQRFREHLREHPFRPPWYMRGAHLQTLIGSQIRRAFSPPRPTVASEDLEILPGLTVSTAQVMRDPSAPTVVVLHGLTGGEESSYMQGLSHKAWAQGWNCLLPNLYNVHPTPPRPVIFDASSSNLVELLLLALKKRHGLDEIYLAGVSLGANKLLKLLGEWGDGAPNWVRAAAVASPLTDIAQSSVKMERRSNRLYQAYFVRRLRRVAREKAGYLSDHLDSSKLEGIRTIRDFDDVCTAEIGGWKDAMDYYRDSSSIRVVERIRVPTVVLHAKDDPFLPYQPLMSAAFQENDHIFVHFTDRGGHLGFFQRRTAGEFDRHWEENRILRFFNLIHGHTA